MFKNIAIVGLYLLFVGCAPQLTRETPLGYTMLPSYLNLDSVYALVVDDTNAVVNESYTDFRSIPLDSGTLTTVYNEKLKIPGGVLFSDRKAALHIFYRSAWERRGTELKAVKVLNKEYYNQTKAGELLYQREIERLRKQAERSWWEQNAAYIGFGAGVLVGVINNYVLLRISR